jgi:predicted nucleic acid-binding protein
VATTGVNYFEVAAGIERERGRRARERMASAWGEILSSLVVLPLTRRATLIAVRRQCELFRSGRSASIADLLIAAIGRAGGCDAIVTRDTGDFGRIGLLKVERH